MVLLTHQHRVVGRVESGEGVREVAKHRKLRAVSGTSPDATGHRKGTKLSMRSVAMAASSCICGIELSRAALLHLVVLVRASDKADG
jgi:hypothetical protein